MTASLQPYPDMKDTGTPVGCIPAHWDVAPISRIGRLFKGMGGSKEDEVDSGVPCVRYGDLYTQHEFVIEWSRAFISPERASSYTQIRPGDVLFAASGETIEDIGRSAVNLIDGDARCGGDVIVLRPRLDVLPRFLGYAADSPAAREQKATMGRGFTIVHIYASELKRLMLPVPPLVEQAAMVRFLDHADHQIRRYIRAKQKLINLLEEQKQAIIYHAVTRGLDFNAPLKASGVEWLGDVPEHWQVSRVKHVARLESGHTPSRSNPLHWLDDNDIPWVSLNDTRALDASDYISDTKYHINPLGLQNSSARVLPSGVVVFTRDAAVGKAAITTRPMAVSQHLIAWVCGSRMLNEYLLRVFYAMKRELDRSTFGATIATIGMDDVGKLITPVPPLEEQHAIAAHLARETARLSSATDQVRRTLQAAREYRTRLIADVVTGKLDVREAASTLPDETDEPKLLDEADGLEGDEGSIDGPSEVLEEAYA